jgi:hypothetical protein
MPVLLTLLGWIALGSEPAPPVASVDPPRTAEGEVTGKERAAPTEGAEYPIDAVARSTVVFLLPTGPRTLQSLEIAPSPGTADAWRLARLRLIRDGEDLRSAGFELPIDQVLERGGATIDRLPMSYRTEAMVRIDSAAPISGRLRLRTSRGVAANADSLEAAARTAAPKVGDLRWLIADPIIFERPFRIGIGEREEGPGSHPSDRPGPIRAGR